MIETVVTYFSLPVIAVSILLIFIRLLKGPHISDRIVSLDLLSTVAIGLIALYSIKTGIREFIDVAIILALLAFLATVAFAYYLERRNK